MFATSQEFGDGVSSLPGENARRNSLSFVHPVGVAGVPGGRFPQPTPLMFVLTQRRTHNSRFESRTHIFVTSFLVNATSPPYNRRIVV